ncbi:MAG: MFS transporter [Phycisphaerae bacterium]|nr:MFS transporter [Phycisphaerae bacterium]
MPEREAEHIDGSTDQSTGVFPEAVCRRAMRVAIISTCFGAVSQILIAESSVIILYSKMLGASQFVALCTTSLQLLVLCVLYIPLAYIMGRAGKKRFIIPAIGVGAAGLLVMAGAAWCGSWSIAVLLGGLCIFSIAIAVYVVGWFPLLKDIVPADKRGHFFGRARVSWQSTSAVFLIISALIVRENPSIIVLQAIIAVAAIGMIVRMVFLTRIPEKPPKPDTGKFTECLMDVFSNRPLMGFSIYLFWLYFFAGATVPVAILMAKVKLNLENDFLVLLSSCMMIGAIVGYFLGGRIVDNRGTKSVFLIAHFSFGLLNIAMLAVQDGSSFCMALLLVIATLYGLIMAGASIAVSSEAFALVTEKLTEMSLAVCIGLYVAGNGLSRFLAGWVLDSGMLAESWTFFGIPMTRYHTLFLVFAAGVIVTCAMLTMLPSVIARRQLPQVR